MDELNRKGNQSIEELSGKLYTRIRNILDSENCWRTLISVLDGKYCLPNTAFNNLETTPKPAHDLLVCLRSRGMTIKELVSYAFQAQIQPILQLFDVRVPARIVQEPFPVWHVNAGESLSLEVKTTGSPSPSFQWFKDNQYLPNANRNVLTVYSLCLGHSGIYTCHVTNGPANDPGVMTNPIQVCVSPAKPVVISVQPRSCTISQHGMALLHCEVEGDVNVDYQWMWNGKEITDEDHMISGSNTNELKLYVLKTEDFDRTGCYCCRISRGEDAIFTQDAVLQVDLDKGVLPPSMPYIATDKVALLMGAGDYRSEPHLTAPKYDVQTMAQIFRSLDFKVVALLDLTQKEMIAAIHEFKQLIGEGVYCVFYFAGHGFETSGQCFLLPPDAPYGYQYTDCLSAENILCNDLLPRRPKLCCMILDMCRLKKDGWTVPRNDNPPPDGDYFVCYGTCRGRKSYEKMTAGLLVSHLRKILTLDLPVEDVFRKLREEIRRDPVFLRDDVQIQAPEVRLNLSDTNRSFHDAIAYTGYTEAFNNRQMRWERSHCQPDSRDLVFSFPGFEVSVRLDFQAELSNVLTIFTSVTDPGSAKRCQAHVSEIPADVARGVVSRSIQEGTEISLCKNALTLHDIQRLRTPLLIKVTATCILHDDTKVERSLEEDLGMPLVSSIELWREYPMLNQYHEPEESEAFV